jgi:choline-glycine betaine transporter
MNPIKSFVTGMVMVPVYLVSGWLVVAGAWQTFEIYESARAKAEQVQANIEKAQSIIQFLPEDK